MRTLTLEEILEARQAAFHPGPPEHAIQFLDDGTLLVTVGAITMMLAAPYTGLPEEGWNHDPRCGCGFCRSRGG